jgi:hypothetical protein
MVFEFRSFENDVERKWTLIKTDALCKNQNIFGEYGELDCDFL